MFFFFTDAAAADVVISFVSLNAVFKQKFFHYFNFFPCYFSCSIIHNILQNTYVSSVCKKFFFRPFWILLSREISSLHYHLNIPHFCILLLHTHFYINYIHVYQCVTNDSNQFYFTSQFLSETTHKNIYNKNVES